MPVPVIDKQTGIRGFLPEDQIDLNRFSVDNSRQPLSYSGQSQQRGRGLLDGILGFIAPNVRGLLDTARLGGMTADAEGSRSTKQSAAESFIRRAKQSTDINERRRLIAQAQALTGQAREGTQNVLNSREYASAPKSFSDAAKMSLGVGTDLGTLLGGLAVPTMARKIGQGALIGGLSGLAGSRGEDAGGTVGSTATGAATGGAVAGVLGLAGKGIGAAMRYLTRNVPEGIVMKSFPGISKPKSGDARRIVSQALDDNLLTGSYDDIARGAERLIDNLDDEFSRASDNLPKVRLGDVFGDRLDENIDTLTEIRGSLARYKNPTAKKAIASIDAVLDQVQKGGSSGAGLLQEMADEPSRLGEFVSDQLDGVTDGTTSATSAISRINDAAKRAGFTEKFSVSDLTNTAQKAVSPADITVSAKTLNDLKRAAYYNFGAAPADETSSVLRSNMKDLGDQVLSFLRGNGELANSTINVDGKAMKIGDLLDAQQTAIVLSQSAGRGATSALEKAPPNIFDISTGMAGLTGLLTGNLPLAAGGLGAVGINRAMRSPAVARTLYKAGDVMEGAQRRMATDLIQRNLARIAAQQATK